VRRVALVANAQPSALPPDALEFAPRRAQVAVAAADAAAVAATPPPPPQLPPKGASTLRTSADEGCRYR